ncbi:hypothetical protein Avbf_14681 [Armadillidium vulgare]|nr:hypothetical protein Avbf_14681 [Armadillidium vulgare]
MLKLSSNPFDFWTFKRPKFSFRYFRNAVNRVFGSQCLYTSTPTFRGWELHFLAKFWCPSLATFTATAMSRSPSGSVKEATKTYAKMGWNLSLFELYIFIRLSMIRK